MGTTSVKNLVQYETLPTSTVTPTSGTQLVPMQYTDSLVPQFNLSYTGTFTTFPFQFTFSNQVIYFNGSFTTTTKTTTSSISTEPNLLTLDFGTTQNLLGLSLTAAALTSFSALSLKYVTVGFALIANAMTTFNFPLLTSVLGINVSANALTTLSLPQLAYCLGGFTISSTTLTTLSLPAIISVTAASSILTPEMTNVTIGSTLKNFASNFVISGAKLTQTSVDNILVRLAALDGTNGTTAYSSRTVTLSGGTSSAPSATGLAAISTLQARSCTVTTN